MKETIEKVFKEYAQGRGWKLNEGESEMFAMSVIAVLDNPPLKEETQHIEAKVAEFLDRARLSADLPPAYEPWFRAALTDAFTKEVEAERKK